MFFSPPIIITAAILGRVALDRPGTFAAMQISKAIRRPTGDDVKLRCSALSQFSSERGALMTNFSPTLALQIPPCSCLHFRACSSTAKSKLGQGSTLFTLASYRQYVGTR